MCMRECVCMHVCAVYVGVRASWPLHVVCMWYALWPSPVTMDREDEAQHDASDATAHNPVGTKSSFLLMQPEVQSCTLSGGWKTP